VREPGLRLTASGPAAAIFSVDRLRKAAGIKSQQICAADFAAVVRVAAGFSASLFTTSGWVVGAVSRGENIAWAAIIIAKIDTKVTIRSRCMAAMLATKR
jgi:hypothetical protein